MTIKTITLMSPDDKDLSYKIQKQLLYEKVGKLGERNYLATFNNKDYLFDNTDNVLNEIVSVQSFELTVDDNKSEYFCSYHLKLWYEQLNCAFNGNYDNSNNETKNNECKYMLTISGMSNKAIFNIQDCIKNNAFNFRTKYKLLSNHTTNECCIFTNVDVTLNEFLRFTYLVLFISTIQDNITKNYPEFVNKLLVYIYQSDSSLDDKSYWHFTLQLNLPSRDMDKHYNYIYGYHS